MQKPFVWGHLLLLLLLLIAFTHCATVRGQLQKDFYASSCPMLYDVVNRTVTDHVMKDPAAAPGLLRLAFHDCFVQGCDASILLDASQIGNSVEKNSPGNIGIHGVEIIDEIKQALEELCPSTVSCADILMLAARDATVLVGLPRYELSTGRRDGLISLEWEANEQIPAPFNAIDVLTGRFLAKGFTIQEMVVLSGGHSVGRSRCKHFRKRLYNYSLAQPQDPLLDPAYAEYLKSLCSAKDLLQPLDENEKPAAMLDSITSNILDNQYYVGLRAGKALLSSDLELMKDKSIRKLVKYFALHQDRWAMEFGKAMVKLSELEVLTGSEGEIRSTCRFAT